MFMPSRHYGSRLSASPEAESACDLPRISSAPNNDFYAESEDSGKIMAAASFPPEIAQFLDDERKCLAKVFREEQYECIIEVGCHAGHNAGWLSALCEEYVGIDINESAIRTAMAQYAGVMGISFICGPVEHVISVILNEKLSPRRAVVLFPFNLFGNFVNVEELIKSFNASGVDLAMSNFNTRSATTLGRYNYYSNCFGRSQIRVYDAEQGVLFKAGLNFRSIAYKSDYLTKLMHDISSYHGILLPFSAYGELFLLTC